MLWERKLTGRGKGGAAPVVACAATGCRSGRVQEREEACAATGLWHVLRQAAGAAGCKSMNIFIVTWQKIVLCCVHL